MTTGERILIADQDGDRPRWAPDGKRFAFISNKEGGSQVWIAEFDGASGTVKSVRKLTSIATEAGGELWSPDGKNILFTSDVYPECDGTSDAKTKCNAKKVKEAEDSKVKALIFDQLLYRHWNAFKAGKRRHIFVTPLIEGGAARDLRLGITTRLSSRLAGRTTMRSRLTDRRFVTPRITTRSKPLPSTTICGPFR